MIKVELELNSSKEAEPAIITEYNILPALSADIDECTEGFVQCDSRATCVNLPGWYHCECRDGYHDNGMFTANGESCEGSLFHSA